MKNKILSVILILALVLSSAFVAYAGPKQDRGNSSSKEKTKVHKEVDKTEIKEMRQTLNEEKAEIEALKDQAEAQKDQIEADYEAAVEAGNVELATQLSVQLDESFKQFNEYKLQLKENIESKKALIKSRYTTEELATINESANQILSEDPEARVLSVDSIISNSAEFKFDTPPVIKSGRTVIPVRAITRGFGAELTWNPETQQVTISKGDTLINLSIDSNTAIVNGEEIVLDSKAEIINNRTYVPLRFVLEALELKVKWDDETDSIQIDTPEELTNDSTSEDTTADTSSEDTTTDTSSEDTTTEGEQLTQDNTSEVLDQPIVEEDTTNTI